MNFFVIMFLLSSVIETDDKKSHDYVMQQQDTIIQYKLNINFTAIFIVNFERLITIVIIKKLTPKELHIKNQNPTFWNVYM